MPPPHTRTDGGGDEARAEAFNVKSGSGQWRCRAIEARFAAASHNQGLQQRRPTCASPLGEAAIIQRAVGFSVRDC
jgi:hypothetical protein